GFRQFQRITFSDSNYHFKSGLYIHGANHGQFNTIWGKYDGGAPYKWLLNTAPQITIEDQTQIAKVYFSAFAEAVLNGNTDYQDLFINANAAADWLPETIMINTFEDSNTKKLITFEEDIDVTSGTWPGSDLLGKDLKIWREEILKFRDNDTQLNNAVVLGWESDSTHLTPSYEINFSKSVQIDTAYSILVNLTAGNPSQLKQNEKGKAEKSAEQQDPEVRFQLELFDSLGYGAIIASDKLKKLTPRLKVQFVKLKGLHQENFGDPWEPTLETFEFPFNQFSKDTNLINLKKIIFRFNQSPKGVLVLDDIAVRRK
ncbi:MAG: hypothetical protein OEU76_08335, partial [Cyclobacteriaceae bacterium]|nr:hypothetical protein [Cyclobacteriaceae bacterium]